MQPVDLALPSLKKHLLAVVALMSTLVLIYGRVGGFDYSGFDDQGYVVHNEMVRSGLTIEGVRWAFTAFHMSNWHPLTWISHMGDVSLFGETPGPQHLVNVVLHGLNSLLVYVLVSWLIRNWIGSLLAAFLFLAHPLHVESVAWIAERKDLLCGLFYLLALLAYVGYVARPGVGRYSLVAGAFALALLSKPMAVSLPLALLLLDYWPLNRLRDAVSGGRGQAWRVAIRLVAEKIPLFLLALASSVVTLVAQGAAIAPMERVPLVYRALNAIIAYSTYVRDALLPTKLAALYPLQPIDVIGALLPSLVVFGGITAASILYRKRYPWLLMGWAWFLLTLLPVIGLVQVGGQSHADRYMYIPSIGLLLALGAALSRLSDAALRKLTLGLAPLLVFYAFLAWVQVGYWSGPYMLFTHTLDVVGSHFQAHINLTPYFLQRGALDEAEKHAQEAVRLAPDSGIAQANLAAVRLQKNDYVGAERLLRRALEISPGDAEIMNNLGIALELQTRVDEARHYFAKALRTNPTLYKVRDNLKRVGG